MKDIEQVIKYNFFFNLIKYYILPISIRSGLKDLNNMDLIKKIHLRFYLNNLFL